MAEAAVQFTPRDYSLVGLESDLAVERGLANAEWYACDIPRKQMKELMRRRNGPAIRDTIIWFGLLLITGVLGGVLWMAGSWWAVAVFAIYGVLYGSVADARWHECGHRTAFKSIWMNDVVYEIASFMMLRDSLPWRWSHTRHHTDTIIVGRDPEIPAPRPPDILGIAMAFFVLKSGPASFKKMILHSFGRMSPEEATYVPESGFPKVYRNARIYLLIYVAVIATAIATKSLLPLMYIGLPSFYGAWFSILCGLTQHLCLAEDVLDHRLNSRTVYMNPIARFMYWEMNYHVEHHMFPMVPYYNLGKLHEALKDDMPKPNSGFYDAYKEIIPALLRQRKDPTYFVKRLLPDSAPAFDASKQG